MTDLATFFICPMNEGQDLNYSETFKGTTENACSRARNMREELARILKDGTISVVVRDDCGIIVWKCV